MLIALDSPLRKIPVGLDRRQQIVLDGLRISADAIDLCYRRLVRSLAELPKASAATAEFRELACSANLDVWTIVDHFHRFAELLRQMPLVKQGIPEFQLLYRAATNVEQLRHYIQHVRNEIDFLTTSGLSVWGSLTWALKEDYDAGHRIKRSLSIGTFYEGNVAAIGGFPEAVHREVDCLEIHAGGRVLQITGLLDHIERVIRGFEEGVQAAAGDDRPRHGSDLLATVTMRPAGA